MNFDYTYIRLLGFTFFEPLAILSNVLFFFLCLYFFVKLKRFNHSYGKQMRWFLLFLGSGGFFGAIAHALHYQLGVDFFRTIFFIMNTLSLLSFYYCFRAPHTYYNLNREPSRLTINLAITWLVAVIGISYLVENFLLIKVHAGIVMLYSLIVHYMVYKRNNEKGSALIVTGILISFGSIVVHSLRLTIHEWFNYKDLAHAIIMSSVFFIYRGITLNSLQLESIESETVQEAVEQPEYAGESGVLTEN